MLNIECGQATLNELVESFRFNDAVLRHLVIARDEAVTEQSAILKSKDEKSERGERRRRDEDGEGSADNDNDSVEAA
jgi:small subunit ribosomal protein S6